MTYVGWYYIEYCLPYRPTVCMFWARNPHTLGAQAAKTKVRRNWATIFLLDIALSSTVECRCRQGRVPIPCYAAILPGHYHCTGPSSPHCTVHVTPTPATTTASQQTQLARSPQPTRRRLSGQAAREKAWLDGRKRRAARTHPCRPAHGARPIGSHVSLPPSVRRAREHLDGMKRDGMARDGIGVGSGWDRGWDGVGPWMGSDEARLAGRHTPLPSASMKDRMG